MTKKKQVKITTGYLRSLGLLPPAYGQYEINRAFKWLGSMTQAEIDEAEAKAKRVNGDSDYYSGTIDYIPAHLLIKLERWAQFVITADIDILENLGLLWPNVAESHIKTAQAYLKEAEEAGVKSPITSASAITADYLRRISIKDFTQALLRSALSDCNLPAKQFKDFFEGSSSACHFWQALKGRKNESVLIIKPFED